MGDGFYRSKDPTNSIKVLKEKRYKEKPRKSQKHKMHIYVQNSKEGRVAKPERGWAAAAVPPTNDGLTQSGTGCFIAVPQWVSKS